METEPAFIVDMDVGKLAVWLRVLGYDTKFINPIDDGELVDIAAAEKRILLTRDTGIFLRKKCTSGEARAFFTKGTDWKDQLREVYREFELNRDNAFSRCVECNGTLSNLSSKDVPSGLPENVLLSQTKFLSCDTCGKVYWPGGHWERMNKMLDSVLGELS